jgi:hypothetical protein
MTNRLNRTDIFIVSIYAREDIGDKRTQDADIKSAKKIWQAIQEGKK